MNNENLHSADPQNAVAPTQNLDFGTALGYLKHGKRIAREGWNGKGMFVYLNKGSVASDSEYVKEFSDGLDVTGPVDGVSAYMFVVSDKGTSTRLPNINMKAATGSTVTGWLASQTDLLSNDWCVVE